VSSSKTDWLCAARTVEYLKYSSSGSSHEVLQRPPLHRYQPLASCFQLRRAGEKAANLLRSAVHAVSHDFNGFVRRRPCELVASHNRTWGSPGFMPTSDVAAAYPTLLTGAIPFEVFPSRQGGSRHQAIAGLFTEDPSPLVIGFSSVLHTGRNQSALRKNALTSGFPCRQSVAHQSRCHVWFARYSLGLHLRLQAFTCRSRRLVQIAETSDLLFEA
jgi:hypothetical protein